jgi:hypothetical protein
MQEMTLAASTLYAGASGRRFTIMGMLFLTALVHLLVAGFRLCRSGENVNDQLRTLDRRVDVMNM